MESFNNLFAGRHVTVFSAAAGGQERTDTGTLQDMQGYWLQLAKDNGEMLLFPFTAVRVIKLLDVEPAYSVPKRSIEPATTPSPAGHPESRL